MEWYWILLIVIGYILLDYFTGLFVYIKLASDYNGVNLLKSDEKYTETNQRIEAARKETFYIAFTIGICFPFFWVFLILYLLIKVFLLIMSPITKMIIKHYLNNEI